jgi:hypothetical protein
MADGIFNPYIEKKKKERPKYVDPILSEAGTPGTKVRLDGDSYVLELKETELDAVPERLAQIIRDVDPDHLVRHHVALTQEKPEEKDDVMVLPTSLGFLSVYVGEGGTEVDVFRRLGNAFYGFKDVLDKHRTRVIVRA